MIPPHQLTAVYIFGRRQAEQGPFAQTHALQIESMQHLVDKGTIDQLTHISSHVLLAFIVSQTSTVAVCALRSSYIWPTAMNDSVPAADEEQHSCRRRNLGSF